MVSTLLGVKPSVCVKNASSVATSGLWSAGRGVISGMVGSILRLQWRQG